MTYFLNSGMFVTLSDYYITVLKEGFSMRHKISRIIIGAIWFVVGVATLISGNMEWWFSGLFLLVGAVFLYTAFKDNKEK